MIRIIALIAAIFLIAFPVWMLADISVPIPKFRKGGYADYVLLTYELLAVYGSVFLGIAIHVGHARWRGQSLLARGIFRAGMLGMLVAASIYFVAGGVYGLIRFGAFDKAIGGTLWGLLAFFWGVFGAMVSAGLALLFYAWRGSAGYPGSAGFGSPPS